MPGDLSAIAQSMAHVLLQNAAAREAFASAMSPFNAAGVAAVINQYAAGGESITAADVPELLPMIRSAITAAEGAPGGAEAVGSIFGGDEAASGSIFGAEKDDDE